MIRGVLTSASGSHNKNCRTFQNVYDHGRRSGGCQCFSWNLGPCAREKSQYGGRNASTLSKRFCIVNDASSVVHVNCSAGRRRARTKFGGTCFRSLCSQYLFQNPCSGICSQPQCSQAACTEGLRLPKKSGGKRTRSLMKKEGEWSWHAPMRRQKVSEEVS